MESMVESKPVLTLEQLLYDAAHILRLGHTANPGEFFNGGIDEARLSNAARSGGWIATEYNNENSPGTFYAVGAQQ